jgi:hypothetical protein
MARFRFYFSRDPTTPSPPTDELLNVEAESKAEALEAIAHDMPQDWSSVWVHVLVWADDDGQQRGFETIRLH